MITTAVVLDHRNRIKRGKEAPLEVRVTVDRKPYYINTGVHVCAQEWHSGIIVNRPDSDELNERLTIIRRKIEQEINDCIAESRAIDVAAIRRKVTECLADESASSTGFLDWCTEQVPLLPIREGTRKHYSTLLTRLTEYGQMLRWRDVTTEGVLSLDAWLRTLTKPQSEAEKALKMTPGPISDAAVYTYHKCLKALLNRALTMGTIDRNPYDRLKGKIKRGEKENIEYLTEDEMHAIEDLRLDEGTPLSLARDIFVFQMYTGMAYADAMAFDISQYRLEGGRWVARQERIKTGVPFVSQLLPPAVSVLEKYGMSLPHMDAADYNHLLKDVGEKAHIGIRMHSHLARHTFATWMLRGGVKIENLQRMLGHNSVVTTQKYAKILAKSVHDDFDMMARKARKARKTRK